MSILEGTELQVTKLASALGAEVRGIDLAAVDTDDIALIKKMLLDHKVLFFPQQHLSQEDHVAFGRNFGPLEGHPNLKNAFTDHPEIFELAASQGGIADEWHTDLTFLPQPSVMSILNMLECPDVGGDTCWTNLCLAYDSLSAPIRELCDGLTALHDALPHNRPEKTAVHPVVRVHPETGQRVLYVNEHFTRRIVEMSHDESEALLTLLTNVVKQERFTVRYRWTKGTLCMWDNRCTQHSVLNDFDSERIIQRVTVMGDKVEGDDPKWQRWPGSRQSALSRFDRQQNRHFG
jgi:taurine dioxygenase